MEPSPARPVKYLYRSELGSVVTRLSARRLLGSQSLCCQVGGRVLSYGGLQPWPVHGVPRVPLPGAGRAGASLLLPHLAPCLGPTPVSILESSQLSSGNVEPQESGTYFHFLFEGYSLFSSFTGIPTHGL